MRVAAALWVVVASVSIVGLAGAQTVPNPGTPTNLAVVGVTQDSITLAWGPSQPGPFITLTETKNSVTVGWGASQDVRSYPITYSVQRDGTTVATAVAGSQYRFAVNRRTTQFRLCVTAQAGPYSSPPGCTTMKRT